MKNVSTLLMDLIIARDPLPEKSVGNASIDGVL